MPRFRRITASTATVLALLTPTALADDLRTPDAREAATGVVATQLSDLRTPDARDAAAGVVSPRPADLRTPDAHDAGASRPLVVPAAPAPVAEFVDSGFSWGDAGLGAAGMLALVLIISAGGILVAQHRRDSRAAAATR